MDFTLPSKLVFVDVETTGTNPRSDRIIEIGLIRVENGEIVESLDTLVNPQQHLPPEIVEITGINPELLHKAPLFEEVIGKVSDLLDDAVFVAHNARFDYAFLKNELRRLEKKYTAKTLCTVRLSRKLFPEARRHNLDAIIERFNFACEKRHRAFPDAYVLWEFYSELARIVPEKLADAVKSLMVNSSLPSSLNKEEIDKLPEGPGVYIFYDNNGLALYIGKSVNLKDRIKSHFTSDHQSNTDLKISSNVHSIEVVETAGEIGALIREASLIKSMQPLYNRRLRRSKTLTALVRSEKNGYLGAEIMPFEKLDEDMMPQVLALFPSLKKAKEKLYSLAEEKELCPKLLGLEKGSGGCFYRQLEKCRGACLGEESNLTYNMRFCTTFLNSRIAKWPYAGPIGIVEETLERSELHLVDNWCYLGSCLEENSGKGFNKSDIKKFDLDIYKILAKILIKKSKPGVKIKILDQETLSSLLT